MAKEYTIVKLPDGKTAKLPPEISQVEAAKILLDKLPDEQYGDFKETLRTKFNIVEETSGWGQTIGGTAGSVLGAIGGGLAGTAAGPAGTVGGGIAGSVAGGAAGGAAGEWIEQLLTGSGDDEDVIEAGAEEALWGLIPGVGGAATKTGLKAASNVANAGSKAIGTVKNIAGSAIGRGAGKGTATRAGVALPLVEVADATLKGSKGLLNKFSILPEAVRNEIMETAIKGTKEFAEKNGIRSVDDQALKYLDDALKFHVNRAYQQVHKGGAIKSGAISGVGKAYEQHQDSFAEGGEVAGWEAEAAKYADANKDVANITARDILEFVPVVGDILGAEEIYRELQKDNVNWPLVGALGGATIIGLIPGIGDAAASGIRAGARAGLKGVKGGIELAKRIEVDPNAVGSLGGNLRLRPKANDAHINDSPHSQQFEVDEAYNIPLEEEFVAPFNPSNPSQGIISDQYGNKFSTVRSNPLRQEIESSGYNPDQQVLPGFDPDTELRMIRNQMGADANRRSGLLGDTPSTTNELASATDTKQSIIAKIMGNDEVSFEEAEDLAEGLLANRRAGDQSELFSADEIRSVKPLPEVEDDFVGLLNAPFERIAKSIDDVKLKGRKNGTVVATDIHDSYDAVLEANPDMSPEDFIKFYQQKGYIPTTKQAKQFIKLRNDPANKAKFEAKMDANRTRRREAKKQSFAYGGLLG